VKLPLGLGVNWKSCFRKIGGPTMIVFPAGLPPRKTTAPASSPRAQQPRVELHAEQLLHNSGVFT